MGGATFKRGCEGHWSTTASAPVKRGSSALKTAPYLRGSGTARSSTARIVGAGMLPNSARPHGSAAGSGKTRSSAVETFAPPGREGQRSTTEAPGPRRMRKRGMAPPNRSGAISVTHGENSIASPSYSIRQRMTANVLGNRASPVATIREAFTLVREDRVGISVSEQRTSHETDALVRPALSKRAELGYDQRDLRLPAGRGRNGRRAQDRRPGQPSPKTGSPDHILAQTDPLGETRVQRGLSAIPVEQTVIMPSVVSTSRLAVPGARRTVSSSGSSALERMSAPSRPNPIGTERARTRSAVPQRCNS